MSILYQFSNTDISIGEEIILSNINWKIIEGQHTRISGKNSSGKTTLCRCIKGNHRVIKGNAGPVNIDFNEIKMVSFTDDGKLFHSVNNVHYYQQRFNAWDADGYLTAKEYLLATGVDPTLPRHRTFLKMLGIDNLLERERIKLSSGQTRKLLLSSALLHEPRLLILDNPYIGLDHKSRIYLNNFIDQLAENTSTTIILSGQADNLPNCIETELELESGQIKYIGRVRRPEFNSNKILQESIPEYVDDFKFKYSGSDNASVIDLNNISVGYKGEPVLENLSWKVLPGEKWSLFGPNGSGKSTLVSLIYADHPQIYSQDISIFGHKLGIGVSIWDIKKRIGFTSPELHAYFRTNYSTADVCYSGLSDKFEILKTPESTDEIFVQNLLDYFHLSEIIDKDYSKLSTGQQRICLLIRALIKNPELLLLDEPFQGMDKENIERSKTLINSIINKDQSMIFISHFKNEIPECANQHFNLEE